MTNETIIQKAYEFAKEHHKNDVSGHNFDHIKRVYENACTLLAQEPQADEFIVKMSALLHDIDDWKLGGDGKQTMAFLKNAGVDEVLLNRIAETIEAIGFATNGGHPDFSTLEQALLFDADKLDTMGAIGICRTILVGAYGKRPLFDPQIFPKKEYTKEEYMDLTRGSSINHFFDKLLKLKNAMQTQTGKKVAEKRHQFMVGFLRQFFEEQNLPEWIKYLDDYLSEGA